MKTLKDIEKKLNEVQEELAEFKKHYRKAPKVGEKIEIAGMKWKILDKLELGYFAIVDGFESLSTKFDEHTNDWKTSDLRNYLNTKFLKKVEEDIGEGTLREFERDLLSLDGQTEYGICNDKVSLLNVDEYRQYRKHLPNTDKWWWLLTPWSTPCNEYDWPVTVVSPSGYFGNGNYNYNYGVRPVCIFPSEIFESEE